MEAPITYKITSLSGCGASMVQDLSWKNAACFWFVDVAEAKGI